MDKAQEEMQNVGFFGIYKESFKTIFSWKKLFAQISFAFTFPLSVIFIVHFIIEEIMDWEIRHDAGTNGHFYHRMSSQWIGYWIFRFVYLSLLLLFSLLSTAAIVYTIASIYVGREVSFKKVVKIVPKVWKRLALTFLWTYFGFFIYNMVSGLVFFIWLSCTNDDSVFGLVVFYILLAISIVGFIYITAIWQLASVVTVLESSYGLKAIMKANTLIKGKRLLSWFIFFSLYCILACILVLFFFSMFLGVMGLILELTLCVFLLMGLFLLGYVAQTMLYLVCKSHHRESIDKLGLSSLLGGYLGEHEPVFKTNQDIQLGQPQPQPQYVQV